MEVSDCCKKWIGGHGFLLFHVLLHNEFSAEHTPQGVTVEKAFYGMRMLYKSGKLAISSAKLYSFVFHFREEQRAIIMVCPHLLLLSFMFAIPTLAVLVSVGAWMVDGILVFLCFGLPTLFMAFLWQLYIQKFIFEGEYHGQKQYDQMCRQFIAALRVPCSLRVISMNRVGWLAVYVSLTWRFLVYAILCCRAGSES